MALRRFAILAIAFLGICLGGAGCGGSPEPVKEEVDGSYQRLRMIRSAYLKAITELGRPPENARELLQFIHYKGDGGPEVVLRSPNDGQEYKILWGISRDDLQPTENGKYPVLAYEQQGKDGRRMVLAVKDVVSMDDEEFKKAPFPPGHKAPF